MTAIAFVALGTSLPGIKKKINGVLKLMYIFFRYICFESSGGT
jgi:hypothetical protein